MNLQEALEWADDNSQPEAVERLRSREAAQILALNIRRYRLWIKEQGEFTDTCTRVILGEVCEGCECKYSNDPHPAIALLDALQDRPVESGKALISKGVKISHKI